VLTGLPAKHYWQHLRPVKLACQKMVPSNFNLTLSLVRTSQHEAPCELGHCPLRSVEVIKNHQNLGLVI